MTEFQFAGLRRFANVRTARHRRPPARPRPAARASAAARAYSARSSAGPPGGAAFSRRRRTGRRGGDARGRSADPMSAEELEASRSWADDLEALAALCAVLAVPIRLRIVMLLAGGERNVTELCKHLRVPQPTVSHRLRILLEGVVVGNRRASRQIYYRLCDPPRGGAHPAGAGATFEAAGYRVRFALGRKTSRDA